MMLYSNAFNLISKLVTYKQVLESQSVIYDKVDVLITQANVRLHRNFALPELDFSLRGLCAGQALPRTWQLRFNLEIYEKQPQAFLSEVPAHEIAHLIAFELYGRSIRPHGKEWQAIMIKVFEQEPHTKHQLEATPTRQERKFSYRCDCQEHQIGIRRHNKITKQGMSYRCKRCHSALRRAI